MLKAAHALVVALATTAFAVVLYPGALLRGEAFFERDLHLDWYSHAAALVRCFETGAWPLWAPGLGFGKPLLADPSTQVLYPFSWLVLALPWNLAYTGFVVIHLSIGALGMARLARSIGAGRAGAWTAAALWALSGPIQSSLNLWHHFAGAAWMAWVLLAYQRACLRPSLVSTGRLAGVAALQALAGSADVVAMTHGVGLAMAAARILLRPRRRRMALGAISAIVAGLALAGALSCAQWWPAADVVSRSARSALPEGVRGAWSVPPWGLARLIAPLDPARVRPALEAWQQLYDQTPPPLLFSLYLGLPALGLALAAFRPGPRRTRALAIAAIGAAAVAFAMGPYGPLYGPLTTLVPVLRVFRYPSKAMLVASLTMALLSGLGVRALASANSSARLVLAGILLLGALGAALVAGPFWTPGAGVVSSGLAGAAALCAALAGRGLRPSLATGALVTLAAADLLVAHRALNPTVPKALLLEVPAVAALVRRDDLRRIQVYDYHTLPGTAWRRLGRTNPYAAAVEAPAIDRRVLDFAAQRQFLVPLTAGFFGIETSFDFDVRRIFPSYQSDLTLYLRHAEGTPTFARLLRLGAVANLISLHEEGLADLTLERSLPGLTGHAIRVFQVKDPRPRAWLVSRTRLADGGDALRALADPSFDPASQAILASGPRLDAVAEPCPSVLWIERRPDRERLETRCERESLLVLADTFDPGWRVSVDGRARALLRANLAFRAVALPPGRHVVEMAYRPTAVVRGLAVSGIALVVALALGVRRRSS